MPIRQCKISQQNNVSKEKAVKGIDKIKFTPRVRTPSMGSLCVSETSECVTR